MEPNIIVSLNDPDSSLSCFLDNLASASSGTGASTGRFVLSIGGTGASDVPGISAAGATPELRRMTPRTDAEVLVCGKPAGGTLPVSPAGIVSPVVITRAALGLIHMPISVNDCGSFSAPEIACTALGSRPAQCLSSGRALELSEVERLFVSGLEIGQDLCDSARLAVLGECVPGGTTTAWGVMSALGYEVDGLLSSSLRHARHDGRKRLVVEGLAKANLDPSAVAAAPLKAVAAVGDPMQPVVAGMALAAAAEIPVILAGGSQMLAVWALVRALARAHGYKLPAGAIAVITTKWVAFDSNAGSSKLAGLLEAPFAAACLDFNKSRHPGLKAYEQGNVKEGVGAGGAIAAAHAAGIGADRLLAAIDQVYDELVLNIGPESPAVCPAPGPAKHSTQASGS